MTVTSLPVVQAGRWVDRGVVRQQRRSRQQRLLLLVAGGSSAVLGWSGLADRSPSYDEALPLRLAALSWSDFASVVWSRETDDVAWHLVVRLLSAVTRPELAMVRLLSVLCVVGAVVLVGLLGARMVGPRAGAAAALLTALHPSVVDASRTADGRGAALLGVVASVLLVDLATRQQVSSGAAWTGAVATAGFAAYCSPITLPVIVAAATATLLWRRRWGVHVVRAFIALIVLLLPLAAAAVTSRLVDSGLLSAARQQGDVWARSFDTLGGGDPWRVPVLVLAVAAVCLAALRRTVLRWPGRGDARDAVLVTWMCAPLVAGAAVSVVAPVLRPELVVFSVPALMLMLTVLVGGLADKRLTVLLLSALTVGLLPGAISASSAQEPRDWRWVARTVAAQALPTDSILLVPTYEQIPLGLAVEQQGLSLSMPAPHGTRSDWTRPPLDTSTPEPLTQELRSSRVWVVVGAEQPALSATSPALAGRELAFEVTRRELRILRYDY